MNQPRIEFDQRHVAQVRRTAVYRAVVGAWCRPVIVACSGGADSTALVATAAIAARNRRVPPFVVVNVDHQTRAESADDGQFVAELARTFDCPFIQASVRAMDSLVGGGPEDTLRRQRYESLAKISTVLGCGGVVTAHMKEDQIETVLLRMLSGSSSIANAGMRPVQALETSNGRLSIIRPLLDVSRQQLHEVLRILGLPFRDDPTNRDIDYRRNQLRLRVIPQLEMLDAGFGDGLIRAVHHASLDAEIADNIADDLVTQHVVSLGDRSLIPRGILQSSHSAISSRIIRRAIEPFLVYESRELTYERTMAVVVAAGGRTGAVIELPYGLAAMIESENVVIKVGDD